MQKPFKRSLAAALAGLAAAANDDPDPWVTVGFVIVRSTTDYREARRIVDEAKDRLGIPVDLRGLVFDGEHGLTFSPEVCEKEALSPFPCYLARGRTDAGVYLSIERSDAYASFRPGYFLVFAANGDPESAELKATLAKVRGLFKDAYLKGGKVYQGCLH